MASGACSYPTGTELNLHKKVLVPAFKGNNKGVLKSKAGFTSEHSVPCYTHTAQGLMRLAGIRFTRVYKKWGGALLGGLAWRT